LQRKSNVNQKEKKRKEWQNESEEKKKLVREVISISLSSQYKINRLERTAVLNKHVDPVTV